MKLLTRSVLFIAVVALAMNGVGYAATIDGSLSFSGLNATQNGVNLSVSTLITTTGTTTAGFGVDDFVVVIPVGTDFGPSTLDLTDLTTFSISNVLYGSFLADRPGSYIVKRDSGFLDVFLRGTYSDLPGYEDSDASLRISVNQSGESISQAITLNAPAFPPQSEVPEPATMALSGLALIGLGALRIFRKT